jgi:hypothetical protein
MADSLVEQKLFGLKVASIYRLIADTASANTHYLQAFLRVFKPSGTLSGVSAGSEFSSLRVKLAKLQAIYLTFLLFHFRPHIFYL